MVILNKNEMEEPPERYDFMLVTDRKGRKIDIIHTGQLRRGDIFPTLFGEALVVKNEPKRRGLVYLERTFNSRGWTGIDLVQSRNGGASIRRGNRVYCNKKSASVKVAHYNPEDDHYMLLNDALNCKGITLTRR